MCRDAGKCESMRVKDIPEIAELSTSEKMLLLEDLWDSIAEDESSIPVPQSQMDELEKRWADYRRDPSNVLTMEELQARINARK